MPANKNQHFIPKFYLRNFASDPCQKNVFFFNLKRQLFKEGGIAGQCARDYFYGKALGTEQMLNVHEGQVAAAIKTILDTSSMPRASGLMRLFVLTQHGRTAHALESVQEMMEHYARFAPDHEYTKPMSDSDAIKMMVLIAIASAPIIDDMASCLILNRSRVDFCTSDNPAVLVNRFYSSGRFRDSSSVGLSKSGLEIYLPLAPRHMLLLYDPNIYNAEGRASDGSVVLRKDADVDVLNGLQVLNALDNLYCASANDEAAVRRVFTRSGPREPEKVSARVFVPGSEPNSFVQCDPDEDLTRHDHLLIGTRPREIKAARTVPFLKRRYVPKYYYDGTALGAVRDYAWGRIVDDYVAALGQQIVTYSQFPSFARTHALYAQVGPWKRKVYGDPL